MWPRRTAPRSSEMVPRARSHSSSSSGQALRSSTRLPRSGTRPSAAASEGALVSSIVGDVGVERRSTRGARAIDVARGGAGSLAARQARGRGLPPPSGYPRAGRPRVPARCVPRRRVRARGLRGGAGAGGRLHRARARRRAARGRLARVRRRHLPTAPHPAPGAGPGRAAAHRPLHRRRAALRVDPSHRASPGFQRQAGAEVRRRCGGTGRRRGDGGSRGAVSPRRVPRDLRGGLQERAPAALQGRPHDS